MNWFGKIKVMNWTDGHVEGIADYEIADKLRVVFGEWIDNGHNDFEDKNTIILCIQLVDGVLLSHGTAYDIEF